LSGAACGTPFPAPLPAPGAGLPPAPPPRDPAISAHPEDWRVELIVGRNLEVDCNQYRFSGRLGSQPLASTRMACPPGEGKRSAFVPMGGKPFVVPYNVSRPIVLYAPKDLELRWRLWKAERQQWPARQI
jgi:ecotin